MSGMSNPASATERKEIMMNTYHAETVLADFFDTLAAHFLQQGHIAHPYDVVAREGYDTMALHASASADFFDGYNPATGKPFAA